MVKGSSERKFPIFWFIKHLSVLGVLQREFLFNLLSCLSKSSGECELLDVGVVFPQYSLEGDLVPLLDIDLSGVFRPRPF